MVAQYGSSYDSSENFSNLICPNSFCPTPFVAIRWHPHRRIRGFRVFSFRPYEWLVLVFCRRLQEGMADYFRNLQLRRCRFQLLAGWCLSFELSKTFLVSIFSDRDTTPPFSQSLTLRRAFEIFSADMFASKSRNRSLVLLFDFDMVLRFCIASASLKSSPISPFSHIFSCLVVVLFFDASDSDVVLAKTDE